MLAAYLFYAVEAGEVGCGYEYGLDLCVLGSLYYGFEVVVEFGCIEV